MNALSANLRNKIFLSSISLPAVILPYLFLTNLLPTSVYGLVSKPNIIQKGMLKLGFQKKLREELVYKYFDGVNKKDRAQISSCFPKEGATIRDVCGVSNSEKIVSNDVLADRCMEFLAAHPDCKVDFHFPPTCGRGLQSKWVFAHWYETGTWSGKSCGIEPDGSPLTVEGQTRFYVSDDLKITHFVVTRTYSEWENKLGSQID